MSHSTLNSSLHRLVLLWQRNRCLHQLTTRGLLTVSSQNPINIKTARDKLKQLIGSPETWRDQRDASIMDIPLPSSQTELPPRRMQDSYTEAVIPFSTDLKLREKYVNFHNAVRFGRIMEDLDTMGVLISYMHNQDPKCDKNAISPLSIVTATVDKIEMKVAEIRIDTDLHIRGHISWVGSTSMEVSMGVHQKQDGVDVSCLEAKFLMVARDPANKNKAFVHPLIVETPEEEKIFQEGKVNKHERETQANQSLLRIPPNEEERLVIHDLFLKTLDTQSVSFKHPRKPEGSEWMETTLLKNLIICFPEQRNLYNKIFGGFLMRIAFELGWTNALVYSKMRPRVVAVDDILFRKPVEIGSLLYLSSQVVYTSGPYLQVKVHAEVVNPKTGHHDTTNIFHYTFKFTSDIPKVMPKSYAEYMMYVDGKRHFDQSYRASSQL